MSLTVTAALLAFIVALGALCGWMGAKPPNPHRGPRLIPYRFIMVICGALVLYLAAHLMFLTGVMKGS